MIKKTAKERWSKRKLIHRLMLSDLLRPEVIKISCPYCINNTKSQYSNFVTNHDSDFLSLYVFLRYDLWFMKMETLLMIRATQTCYFPDLIKIENKESRLSPFSIMFFSTVGYNSYNLISHKNILKLVNC